MGLRLRAVLGTGTVDYVNVSERSRTVEELGPATETFDRTRFMTRQGDDDSFDEERTGSIHWYPGCSSHRVRETTRGWSFETLRLKTCARAVSCVIRS